MIDIVASHRNRLGCSEIAQALGVSPWGTPLELWEQKTGRVRRPDISDDLRIKLGHRLEQVVAELYCAETGHRVARDNRSHTLPNLPLVGNIDRRIVGAKRGLEIKTSLGKFGGADWTDASDGIPLHYLMQVNGYLLLTGWESWDVAALLAGPQLRIYTIQRDPEMERLIIDGVREFWRCVETDTPPAPVSSEDANRRWPHSSTDTKAASDSARVYIERLREIHALVADAEREAEHIELLLKTEMQDAEALADEKGRPLVTWKTSTSRRIDTAALKLAMPDIAAQYTRETQSRRFSLKGSKHHES